MGRGKIPINAIFPKRAIDAIRRAGKPHHFPVVGGRDINQQSAGMAFTNLAAHWQGANHVAQRGEAENNHGFFPMPRALEQQPGRKIYKIKVLLNLFPQRPQGRSQRAGERGHHRFAEAAHINIFYDQLD